MTRQSQADKFEPNDEATVYQLTDDIIGDLQQDNSHSLLSATDRQPKAKRNDTPALSVPNNQLLDAKADNVRTQFLAWVVAGLQNRTLDCNNPGARVRGR